MPTGNHNSGVFICPEVGSQRVAQAGLTLRLLPPPLGCPAAGACHGEHMLPPHLQPQGSHRKQEPLLCLPFLDRPADLTLEQRCQHVTCVDATSASSQA